jgi:hypothetical protein
MLVTKQGEITSASAFFQNLGRIGHEGSCLLTYPTIKEDSLFGLFCYSEIIPN